jgi:hypothetical protein
LGSDTHFSSKLGSDTHFSSEEKWVSDPNFVGLEGDGLPEKSGSYSIHMVPAKRPPFLLRQIQAPGDNFHD